MKKDVTELHEEIERSKQENERKFDEIRQLRDELSTKHDIVEKEQRNKDRIKRELEEINHQMSLKQSDIKQKQITIVGNQEKIKNLELQLKEQRSLTEKALKVLKSKRLLTFRITRV